MKRLILLLLLVTISLSVYAQKDDNVSVGYIRKEITIIEKQKQEKQKQEKQKKEYQKFDAKRGLTHIVEFHPKVYPSEKKSQISFSYIAGWRFNNWFLAGVGTGIDFATYVPHEQRDKLGKEPEMLYRSGFYDVYDDYLKGSINGVSIPLYAHAKFYYMRTRWSPYSSVSLGGRLSPKDCGAYFDFSVGVNYIPPQTFTDKYKVTAFFAAIGLSISEMQNLREENDVKYYPGGCSDSACPYVQSATRHSHLMTSVRVGSKVTYYGLSFRLGVSF